MVLHVFILLVGFLFLVKGADWFVEGAAGIARKLGIPQLVIGLTIVAMGTSMPEAAVSITAALNNNAGITIGNIVGSNILNILIILGITAVITNVAIQKSTLLYEIPFMIGITALLLVFGLTGSSITFIEGVVFLLLFIAFLVYLFIMSKKGEVQEEGEIKDIPVWKCLLFMVIGGVMVVKGSDFAVSGASWIARFFGMSERFIGLTIVAMGTSLPETAVSVTASLVNNNELAVSNVVGSNIFNLMVVVGVCSILTPILVQKETIRRDIPFSMICALLLLGLGILAAGDTIGMRLGHLDGMILLGFFAAAAIAMPSAQAADRTVSELIPVGQTVGVKLFSDGVLVVGFSDGESPAKDCGLKEGDVITAICGQSLDTIEEFRQLLAENGEDAVALTVKRGSRTIELSAEPEKDEDGEYRLGAWVRDSMAGIGTMTFFDPQSGTFGALGHGVTDVDTGQLLPLDHGSIMDASVKAVKKGERASPGELKGDFDLTRDSGTLYANTECGIFGKLSAEDAAKITGAALPIAKKDEIKTGRAAILATVSGNETREYDIEIEKIYSPSGSTRNLLLRVTDEELLAQTGGVVQGMSGSAILQDGKIIGAVTHVLLDDPSRGYGIFIENMLSAAGLSSE